jgi:hypothetical protein
VPRKYQISGKGLEAWYESVAAHQSQISTFWSTSEKLRIAIKEYYSAHEGIILWEKD